MTPRAWSAYICKDVLLKYAARIRGLSKRSHWTRSGPGSSWRACLWASGLSFQMWTDGQSLTHLCGVSESTKFFVKIIKASSFRTQWDYSFKNLLTILGLNGGWTSLFSIFSQSIRRKKRWLRTSSSPLFPHPSRFCGFLVKKPLQTSLASLLRFFGYDTLWSVIAANNSSSSSPSNGGCPTSISYRRTP